ncbi:MAG: hypothetical protein FH748_05780 [Balneolaceae bacterium]|nr:hypothetical protein [Balneolaceae bacterium]
MGVMEKMRNSTAIILWVLIGSFGLVWVLADVNFFDAIQAGPNALGVVNGEEITIEEYNNRIQYYSTAYSQQTGSAMTPEMRARYETQAWNELVNTRLITQKMDELGITVTDQELLDMVYGENPDPIIRQNFTREDGTIDRAAIQQVLSSNEFSQQAIALEVQLRQKRRQQKLNSYIEAGLQVTDADIEQEYIRQNTTADVSFVRFPYSEISEDQLDITEQDLQTYYNDHKDRYKRNETYKIKYVSFSKLPTKEDTTQIMKEIADLRSAFQNAGNDSLFLARQASTTQYRNVFVAKDEVRDEYSAVLDLKEGEVSDVILNGGQAAILKKVADNGDEVKFEIMSYNIEALPSTLDEVNEQASDFEFYAAEESAFEEEAERRNLEIKNVTVTKGSNFIPGIGSSQQIMNFAEGADEGDLSEVLELNSNFVVAKLDDVIPDGYRPLEEVRSQVENQVKITKRKEFTLDKANKLLSTNRSLSELAEASEKDIQTSTSVRRNSIVLTGAGREPAVIGTIFTLDEGTISETLAGESAAYVVRVDQKNEADITGLDQPTKNQIKQRLERQKTEKFNSVWLQQLKENASIIDNRHRLLNP